MSAKSLCINHMMEMAHFLEKWGELVLRVSKTSI